jgi:hypothetical protein
MLNPDTMEKVLEHFPKAGQKMDERFRPKIIIKESKFANYATKFSIAIALTGEPSASLIFNGRQMK